MQPRSFRAIAALAAVVLIAGARPARAEDAAQARELFTQGNTFFDLGQFDKAIDAWQRGYQLKNDPGFLYNIAQAYRTTGEAQKAIFFYKRYLSNAPKAHNRAEVEQKIDVLQKQLAAQEPSKQRAAPGPPLSSATPEPAPTPAAPPPAATTTTTAEPVAPAPPVPAVPAPEPPAPAGLASVPPPATGLRVRRIDLGAGAGVDTWPSGLQRHAQPSFAFALAGGYTFGPPGAELRFRLGLLFGYTFLEEAGGRDSFVWLAIDPTMVIRMSPRMRLFADLGLGFVSMSGLTADSALLAMPTSTSPVNVSGAQTVSLARLGAGASYDLLPSLSAFVWPAIASSAKKQDLYGAITRVELLAGLAYRL